MIFWGIIKVEKRNLQKNEFSIKNKKLKKVNYPKGWGAKLWV